MKITEDFKDIEKMSCGNFTEHTRVCAEMADQGVNSGHASFAFGANQKGSASIHFQRACHNNLKYATNSTFWLVNYYVKNTRVEAENFLLYLTAGPYKAAVSDALFYRENGKTKYIAWDNVAEKDIKLLANFLIATRLISEFNAGRFWRYLLDNGFTEDTAFILMNCCNFDFNTGDISGHIGCYGDMPLSPQMKMRRSDKYLDPLRIYNRDPRPGETLKANGSSYLCNYIWGGRDTPLVILQDKHKYRVGAINATDESGNEGHPYSITMNKIAKTFKEKKPLDKAFVEEIEKTLRAGGQIE